MSFEHIIPLTVIILKELKEYMCTYVLKNMCIHHFYDKIVLRARLGRTHTKNKNVRYNIIQVCLTTFP